MTKMLRRSTSGIACAMALSLATFPLSWSADAPVAEAADIATVTCDPVAATQPSTEPTLLSFDPQIPERIIDTRNATGGVAAPLGAGCTLQINMSGVGVSASEIDAFALSVTVISAERGFFTAFPCAAGQPGTSSVNARPGIPTPNLVVGVPDGDGMVCLFSQRGGNVVIDVSGWWADGANRFTPIEPARAYDTRTLKQPVKLPANAVRDIEIAGVVVPEDAVSITLNVAVVAPETSGFLVVYPCGFPVPLASNLNFVAGERRAVAAIVDLGPKADQAASGRLCVSVNATTHFLVDVTGYDAPSAATSPDLVIEPLADTRIVDTRIPGVPGTRFAARTTQRFDLSSVIDRPDDAVAVVLNAVAVRAERASFVSISPCTAGPPATSSLNYDLNQTANLVVTALSPDGAFCVYADTAVDIVIDLVGVVTGPPGSLVNQLSFSEIDGTLAPLEQEFAVDGPDSTTHCDGDRSVRLRLGLAPRVIASVNGVGVADRDPVAPDVPITLTEDGLLTIELTRGSETATYSIRCLPADFPRLSVETAEGAAPGWYLTDLGTNAPGGDFLAILNERGVPVWYQRLDQNLIDAKLLSTGNIVASENPRAFTTDPSTGHRVIALDGSLVDVHVTDSDTYPADKHDYAEIAGLPAGRAIISYPLVTGVDLSALDPAAVQRAPAQFRCPSSVIGPNQTIVDGVIRELRADGADAGTAPDLLWEWTSSEYFSIAEVRFPLCFKNTASNPEEVDPFHINSISRVVENNCGVACDYIVSARHLDAVFRIDRSTKAVEWILSSTPESVPNKSGAERLNIVDDPLGGPLRMHDAILDGDILTMHDNRTASGQPSRFVQYRIDTSSPVRANWTATLTRQVDAPFGRTSGALGSARLAADGSVLMGWGALQPAFVEYGSDGTELLRVTVAGGASSYRIVKYAPNVFDADELRATAGNTTQPPS